MEVNIVEFGAVPGGEVLCTESIQCAIDKCHLNGGGTVVVPSGVFLSGTIRLKSNVELHLSHGAVLLASDKMEDYNEVDEYEQNFSCLSEEWLGKHFILAVECNNIAITGTGTIDGRGEAFFGEKRPFNNYCWRDGIAFSKDKEKLRPAQTVCVVESSDITIRDVTIKNSPCWCCFLHGCDNAVIDGIKVFNKSFHANTDGIDIDSSSHVTISNCIINTGDDGITFRACQARLKNKNHICEYVTVSNCVISCSSSAFRIGVGVGTIRHIRVSNIAIERCSVVSDFMTSYVGVGCANMEDIAFSGISAAGTAYPLKVYAGNNAYVKDLTYENVCVEATAGILLEAEPNHICSGISLKNVHIKLRHGPANLSDEDIKLRGKSVIAAKGISELQMDNVKISGEESVLSEWEDYLSVKDCPNSHINNVFLPQ